MKYNPDIHHRRSIRLKGYDYGQAGAYFLTLCAQNRECLFGDIQDNVVLLNQNGEIVYQVWHQIPHHFPNVEIDYAVVMPNHFHGILVLLDESAKNDSTDNNEGGEEGEETSPLRGGKRPTLGKIVGYFKYQSTKIINQMRDMPGVKVWQRNFYEHIVRNESSLDQLRQYIVQNPQRWSVDQLNASNPSKW